jgi:DNA adenine methylase
MNYMGGKYKLLPQILPLFPPEINTFVDLFAGGLDVALNVSSELTLCVDLNTPMIELYQAIQAKTEKQILAYISARVRKFELSKTNTDGYLKLREAYNKRGNPLDLFVLIAHSFNHQARFNGDLKFNTPFGTNRSSFNPIMRANLVAMVRQIQSGNYQFVAGDFREIPLQGLTEHDFLYADPPYLISSGTYNDGRRGYGGWGAGDDADLRDLLDGLDAQGVSWALSNVTHHKGLKNTALIKWSKRYVTHALAYNYNNSNYRTGSRANQTREVLITNVATPEVV